MKIIAPHEFESRYPRRPAPVQVVCRARGNIVVRRDTSLAGRLRGRVVVEPGSQLVVDGEIAGRLIVAPNAIAYVRGRVKGDLVLGGHAFVQGDVAGRVLGSPGSRLCVVGKVRGATKGLE